MQKGKTYRSTSLLIYFTCSFFFFSFSLFGQHRGDDLLFQGITNSNDNGVKATAMGSAVTSLSGDVSSIFYNPAGLSTIANIQFSIAGNGSSISWRENQNWRPNRYFVTLPFYLEGLYTPDPEEDGMYDHERVWTDDFQIDSTYIVNPPDLGLDPYSEEAGDWNSTSSSFTFNNVAVAIPFNISGEKFVASTAYNRKVNIEDYDRNETYLDPYIGYLEYGEIGRVNGVDTLIMDWYDYKRSISGEIDNLVFAIAYDISDIIKLGLGMNISWGSSTDLQSLSGVGVFHLIRQQRFKYWHKDEYSETKGESDYSATSFNLGMQFDFNQFKFGFKIDLPYTLEKNWNYTQTFQDTNGTVSSNSSGTNKAEIPAIFNFGVSFQPVSNFIVAIDYEYAPLSETSFSLSQEYPYFKGWVDKHTFRFGIDYAPWDFLSILAGYRNMPTNFVPDGAAVRDSAPKANSYTFGLSFPTVFGRFDLTYEYRLLQYYDSYYSNTNYNTIEYNNLLLGYTYEF
ncbi:MAG: hypothetical protein KAJ10_06975 [Thermodesulfovibrionia bacterium]|nr:hypothetical protein [Thermodesulfovibrionia bacterium]